MRTAVGHITRNIKIRGNQDPTNLGGHLQVYHYIYEDIEKGLNINARGSAILEGVELENMGQRDSENSALHIVNTHQPSPELLLTQLIGCSIHDSKGLSING